MAAQTPLTKRIWRNLLAMMSPLCKRRAMCKARWIPRE
jgi:hypothetical protein